MRFLEAMQMTAGKAAVKFTLRRLETKITEAKIKEAEAGYGKKSDSTSNHEEAGATPAEAQGEKEMLKLEAAEAARAGRVFRQLDKDGSGALDKEEMVILFATGPETFVTLDADGDGKVSEEEWMRFLEAMQMTAGKAAVKFVIKRLETKMMEAAVRDGRKGASTSNHEEAAAAAGVQYTTRGDKEMRKLEAFMPGGNVFRKLDKDVNTTLDKDEMEVVYATAQQVFKQLDMDGSNMIDKELTVLLHATGPETFAMLDADGDGKVSEGEWLCFLAALQVHAGRHTVQLLLRELEKNVAVVTEEHAETQYQNELCANFAGEREGAQSYFMQDANELHDMLHARVSSNTYNTKPLGPATAMQPTDRSVHSHSYYRVNAGAPFPGPSNVAPRIQDSNPSALTGHVEFHVGGAHRQHYTTDSVSGLQHLKSRFDSAPPLGLRDMYATPPVDQYRAHFEPNLASQPHHPLATQFVSPEPERPWRQQPVSSPVTTPDKKLSGLYGFRLLTGYK